MDFIKRKCLRLAYGLPSPLAQMLCGREPSVLLYHSVPRKTVQSGKYAFDGAAFERQIVHLKKHFDFIRPEDYFSPRPLRARKAILLTFDDGLRNNAVVAAPVLRKYEVPAIFFACNRHSANESILWFSYLKALKHHFTSNGFMFRGEYFDMAQRARNPALSRLTDMLLALKPHPAALYAAIENELPRVETFVGKQELADWYAGMTQEQLGELAADKLFSVQSHTADHPFLTRCEPEEMKRQLSENKSFLERVCGKAVTAISYPVGDYNQAVVDECARQGFTTGYAVIPRIRDNQPEFEIPRAGVYQPAEEIAAFKAMWARRRENKG